MAIHEIAASVRGAMLRRRLRVARKPESHPRGHSALPDSRKETESNASAKDVFAENVKPIRFLSIRRRLQAVRFDLGMNRAAANVFASPLREFRARRPSSIGRLTDALAIRALVETRAK